ncbi:MAG TPA: hypothetical protein VHC47_12100 [Mucilaginibacter sp.]|nr:hypothetical protein [Mucilaginibacter sp.]
MIIKSKPLPIPLLKLSALWLSLILRLRFKKLVIRQARIMPGTSYMLMCNHFSFWDGVLAIYVVVYAVSRKQPIKGLYIMSVKKQMEKKWWLRYMGSFSIDPGKLSVNESLDYAAEVLNTPGNLLLYYPQGNLESIHTRHIVFQEGVYEIITRIKGTCQLLWCSILAEYFESLKQTLYFNMLDCGTNRDFDFDELKRKVNEFHNQAIQENFRFTKEP